MWRSSRGRLLRPHVPGGGARGVAYMRRGKPTKSRKRPHAVFNSAFCALRACSHTAVLQLRKRSEPCGNGGRTSAGKGWVSVRRAAWSVATGACVSMLWSLRHACAPHFLHCPSASVSIPLTLSSRLCLCLCLCRLPLPLPRRSLCLCFWLGLCLPSRSLACMQHAPTMLTTMALCSREKNAHCTRIPPKKATFGSTGSVGLQVHMQYV